MARNKWVHIRVSEEEHRLWRNQASNARLNLADLIRLRMDCESVGRPPTLQRPTKKANPELIAALGRIGNNLNQLARWANTYGQGIDSVALLSELVKIREAIHNLPGKKKRSC